ncbi:MAG: hypothetical protein KKH72_14055 [Alphaproteobacteria bacterium]|nr:hypothetical protein [Alphaproteobacteria bacterium]
MSSCSNFVFELKAGANSTEVTVDFGHGIKTWSAGPNFFKAPNGVPTWTGRDLGLAGTAGMQAVLHLAEQIDDLPLHASGELDVLYTPSKTGRYVPSKGTWELVSKH